MKKRHFEACRCALKGLDLAEKEIALSILGNILTVYVEVGSNQLIAVRQGWGEEAQSPVT